MNTCDKSNAASKVEIASRGNHFRVTGQPGAAQAGGDVLLSLFAMTDNERLDPERVHMLLQESLMNDGDLTPANQNRAKSTTLRFRRAQN